MKYYGCSFALATIPIPYSPIRYTHPHIPPPPPFVCTLQSTGWGVWALVPPPSYASDGGAARICQWGGGGGVFDKMPLLLGCVVAYTNPLPPTFVFVLSNQQGVEA